MKSSIKLILFIAFYLPLLINSGTAECLGYAGSVVPAIVSDETGLQTTGKLIDVSLNLVNGDGTVYLQTHPPTGTSTQKSATDAVTYAFSRSNKYIDECNVLIKIEGKGLTGYVEGPSAGVAFSVLVYAAINNFTIPNDVTFTGSIDKDGNVKKVGGLYEKSKMAGRKGIKYFIIPVEDIHEILLLKPLEKQYGMQILQIENVDEAIDFIFYNTTIEKKEFKAEVKVLPTLTVHDTFDNGDLTKFKEIALAMIELESKRVYSLSESLNETKELKKFFLQEIENQKVLLEKGYIFTAANGAFLNYIYATSLGILENVENLDLYKEKERVIACVNALKNYKKTFNNFEWLAGADIRKEWALTKISNTNVDEPLLADEKYFVFNELMYADAWCHVSNELRNMIDEKGKEIDESSLKELAKDKLEEAQSLTIYDNDLKFHLQAAKNLFDKELYAGAVYDSVFIITSVHAIDYIKTHSSNQINDEIEEMKGKNRSSLWGKLYQGHGVFLAQQKGTENVAYKIFKFAEGLDEATEEIKKRLTEKNETIKGTKNGESIFYFIVVILIIVLVSLMYNLIKK